MTQKIQTPPWAKRLASRFHDAVDLEVARQRMPEKFKPLATYNSEVARGVVHTPQWTAQMRMLQQEFDAWAAKIREHL
jgi:hypothetical protein